MIRGHHFSSAVSLCRFKDCARHRFRALLPAAGQLRSGVCGVCRPCERGRKRRSETRELHFVEAAAAPVSFWTRGTTGLGPRTFSGCSAGGPGSAGAGRSLCSGPCELSVRTGAEPGAGACGGAGPPPRGRPGSGAGDLEGSGRSPPDVPPASCPRRFTASDVSDCDRGRVFWFI